MDYIEDHYINKDEEPRLLSRHGRMEYLTTMKYIHDALELEYEKKQKILESRKTIRKTKDEFIKRSGITDKDSGKNK